MVNIAYDKLRDERIRHIHINLNMLAEIESNLIHNIECNSGDPTASVLALSRQAKCRAKLSWFEKGDLNSFRQWSYVSAKLRQKYYQLETDTINPGLKNIELLEPLVSNNSVLIEWYANYDAIYDLKRVEKSNTGDFFAYQSIVALRGDWPQLLTRSKFVMDNPPSSLKRWQDYHYFYLALAEKNVVKMELVLQAMVEPKNVRSRCSEETGITENLIFSRIIIAMKIAWIHGFEVKVDSPYIPMVWMPTKSLAHYDNFYSFLN